MGTYSLITQTLTILLWEYFTLFSSLGLLRMRVLVSHFSRWTTFNVSALL